MLDFLFPNAAQAHETSRDKTVAEKKVKTLETTIEGLKESAKATARRVSDDNYEERRSRRIDANDYEDTITRLKRDVETETNLRLGATAEVEDRLEREVAAEVVSIQAEADAQVLKAESERDIARAEATLLAQKNSAEEVNNLKDTLAGAIARSTAAEARSETMDTVVEGLEGQVDGYRKFVEFAMTKLPNVDMSKFNINVEVPAAEVNVSPNVVVEN